MADALARHDVLLRTAVEAHHGRVIKTTGDGIYAAFDDAAEGLNAAIAIQQSVADPAATAGMSLPVRCGLHAGPAHERDNDFFGGTINRAARIMGLAYGGQVLASQAVADLVAGRLPAESSLRDLGDVRLRGIASSEHVYQVVHPSLRQEFPALRSLEVTPNNLPKHLTSFIGREREIEEAEQLLDRARLLTLLGIGGLGKTRLSLQIAGDVLESYRDGAWLVDLAPIRDPSIVASEAAKVLGVREEPGRPLIETLCAHLKPRNLLLILDNCEHLIKPSAELVHAILRAAPEVRVIATSREALRVPGEQSYTVTPLPVPNRSDGIEALARSPAVRLFVERAQLHRPELCARRTGCPRSGRTGCPTGGHSARDRAGCRASAGAHGCRHQRAPQGSLQAPDGWRPRAARATTDTAGIGRLVVRPAPGTRASAAREAGGFRERIRARRRPRRSAAPTL